MNETSDNQSDPSAGFMNAWAESLSKILQAAGTFTPDTMPPEMMRQIRSGIFQALSKSWEEFMRSPQFLEGMKQMLDQSVALRKMSNDFLSKARQEFRGAGREDVDDILLAVRELEARLTRRVDDLAAQIGGARSGAKPTKPAAKRSRPASGRAPARPRKPARSRR